MTKYLSLKYLFFLDFDLEHYFFKYISNAKFLCLLLLNLHLQELGIFGALTNIEEYQLNVIAFDFDILSMENHSAFYDINIHEDMTSLFLVAKAVVAIQKQYGVIPLMFGKGNCAKVSPL